MLSSRNIQHCSSSRSVASTPSQCAYICLYTIYYNIVCSIYIYIGAVPRDLVCGCLCVCVRGEIEKKRVRIGVARTTGLQQLVLSRLRRNNNNRTSSSSSSYRDNCCLPRLCAQLPLVASFYAARNGNGATATATATSPKCSSGDDESSSYTNNSTLSAACISSSSSSSSSCCSGGPRPARRRRASPRSLLPATMSFLL